MSLKVQLEHLEQKVAILTERVNQGDEWKKHLENWLVSNLGLNIPPQLSLCKDTSKTNANHEVNDSSSKENEDSHFGSAVKFRAKRTYAQDSKKSGGNTEGKTYPKKKRISAVATAAAGENHKQVVIDPNSHIVTSGASGNNHDRAGNGGGTNHEVDIGPGGHNYIVTSAEVVQSPDNEIIIENVNVKYESAEMVEEQEQPEPMEMNAVDGVTTETIITSSGADHHGGQEETRYRIQEENNVLHIIKIEGTDGLAVDGEQAVINYGSALPIVHLTGVDGTSQLPGNLAVFSGPLGEETAIGFLNPDGSVTPCRPNVIISTNSGIPVGSTIQHHEVVASPAPSTPETKTPEDPIDPKGTFVCNICGNSFQGLYLFRQHEKKSECRRMAKLAKNKKPEGALPSSFPKLIDSVPPSSVIPSTKTVLPPPVNPNTLKFKCSMCGSCYASEAYLRFHMSKVHNVGKNSS